MGKVLVTLQKFRAIKAELKNLKTVERKKIADDLSQFRDDVGLDEDGAYNDTLLAQSDLEERIAQLEEIVENAEIIKPPRTAKVNVGSTILIRRVGDRKQVSMKLVGAVDADPSLNYISNESPLGKALVGKKKDDIIPVITPHGQVQYKILNVS